MTRGTCTLHRVPEDSELLDGGGAVIGLITTNPAKDSVGLRTHLAEKPHFRLQGPFSQILDGIWGIKTGKITCDQVLTGPLPR